MISLSAEATATLAESWVQYVRVQSLLDDTVLAEDVPVASGTEEIDRSSNVPERLALIVPRVDDDGFAWDPGGSVGHPLSPYGQRLVVQVGIGLTEDRVEWVTRGEYLVTEATVYGDNVEVEAVGLLALVEEARFTTPYQPSGTFKSTVRGLVEPALTVRFETVGNGLPADRAIPGGMSWDEDRLGALAEVLDAWPAEASVTPDGDLFVSPVQDGSVVALALADGVSGTVVEWSSGQKRDGAINMVVARGQATDTTQVQGVAYDTNPNSATRYGGPFSPLPVPLFYFSPLLTTSAQCATAAATMLARRLRTNARILSVRCAPNPALQVGDRVTVTNDSLTNAAGIVESLRLPLVPGGNDAMELAVRLL